MYAATHETLVWRSDVIFTIFFSHPFRLDQVPKQIHSYTMIYIFQYEHALHSVRQYIFYLLRWITDNTIWRHIGVRHNDDIHTSYVYPFIYPSHIALTSSAQFYTITKRIPFHCRNVFFFFNFSAMFPTTHNRIFASFVLYHRVWRVLRNACDFLMLELHVLWIFT